MKTHYKNTHIVAKVVLLFVLFFFSSFSVFSSSQQRFQVSGVNTSPVANGVYIPVGAYGQINWTYFKHETHEFYLYFEDFWAPGGLPGLQIHNGRWNLALSLPYDGVSWVIVAFDIINVPEDFQGPTSLGDVIVTNITAVLSATTQEAMNIASTSATLHGSVRAAYTTGTVSFEYGITNSYGNEVSATPSQSTDNEEFAVSTDLADLLPSTTYYYRVKIESDDEIIYGESLSFQTEDISGNVETNSLQKITLYPNPATEGFYVDADEEVDVLTMYNISGCIVYQQQVSGKSYVDIRDLRNGIYLLIINGNHITLVKSE